MSKKNTLTVAVGFDGVIHSYTSGWTGLVTISDPPVPGAFEFLTRLVRSQVWVVIHSRRVGQQCPATGLYGEQAITAWMLAHGLDPDIVRDIKFATRGKPEADVYIDDLAFRFEGAFPTVDELKAAASPWSENSYAVLRHTDGSLFSVSQFDSSEEGREFLDPHPKNERLSGLVFPEDVAKMSDEERREVVSVIRNMRTPHVDESSIADRLEPVARWLGKVADPNDYHELVTDVIESLRGR